LTFPFFGGGEAGANILEAEAADAGEPNPPQPALVRPALLQPYPTNRPLAGLFCRTGDPTTPAEDESTPSKSKGSAILIQIQWAYYVDVHFFADTQFNSDTIVPGQAKNLASRHKMLLAGLQGHKDQSEPLKQMTLTYWILAFAAPPSS